MSASFEAFCAKFAFQPGLRGCVGVEREFFLMDEDGVPQPRSPEFLANVDDLGWTYELSACQVEHRTIPHRLRTTLEQDLRISRRHGGLVAVDLGLSLAGKEVAQADMTTAIYPDDARYAGIAERIGPEKLLAACRVAGVHFHLGTSDLSHAIAVHNRLIPYIDELCKMGDHSNGERLRLYATMAIRGTPPTYTSPEHFYEDALANNFAENPRDCWNLVRISRHGTVELRMFGMTDDEKEIMKWVAHVMGLAGL